MKKDERISDEQLDALMDGELDAEEESMIYSLSESCPELDGRMCQHRKVKQLVQHAYRDLPQPKRPGHGRPPRKMLLGLAAAALMVLAIGLAGGWYAAKASGGAPLAADQTASVVSDTWLLHVASADPERMKRALDRAESLMNGPGGETRRVEIVANEGGLDLLRSDVTPYADRIEQLAARDVLFFACSRAIERLEEHGVRVSLVPEANTHYTALDRVVQRLRQGWTYEKI
jgi:intracellular sulfur oxidation DsrE/DsrF family protein